MGTSWSREAITQEIQRLHRNKVALNSGSIRKTHTALYGAATYHFGGWKQAVKVAGLEYEAVSVKVFKEPRRTWSKEEVVKEIRRLHGAGADLSARNATMEHSRLYGAGCHYFSSWKNALKAADLNEEKIRKRPAFRSWSKDAVMAGIHSRHAADLPLNSRAVELSDLTLYQSGTRLFGSWASALKEAGFDPKDIYLARTKPWTEHEFAQEIKKLQGQDIDLSMVTMVRLGRGDLLNGARKLHGGWKQALEALGLDYDAIKERRDAWTADEVVQVIQHLAKEGHRLSHGWAKENHNGLTHAALAHFGKWDQALTAAGLNYREHARYWSTEAWLRHLSEAEYETIIDRSSENST